MHGSHSEEGARTLREQRPSDFGYRGRIEIQEQKPARLGTEAEECKIYFSSVFPQH
jgi:hypothetical protein